MRGSFYTIYCSNFLYKISTNIFNKLSLIIILILLLVFSITYIYYFFIELHIAIYIISVFLIFLLSTRFVTLSYTYYILHFF